MVLLTVADGGFQIWIYYGARRCYFLSFLFADSSRLVVFCHVDKAKNEKKRKKERNELFASPTAPLTEGTVKM